MKIFKVIGMTALAASMAVSAVPASALFLSFDASSSSTNGSGAFPTSGTVEFAFSDATDATDGKGVKLDVTVANTSSAPVTASVLSAVAFDFGGIGTFRSASFVPGAFLINDYLTPKSDLTGISLDFCASGSGGMNCPGGSGGIPGPDGASNVDMFSFILDTESSVSDVEGAFATLFSGTYDKKEAPIVLKWQGIDLEDGSTGGSETKYNPSVVPLPASSVLLLGLMGAGGIAAWRKSRRAA